jgi:hypothetical protein
MKAILFGLASFLFVGFFAAGSASAQAVRTFVASTGNDSNDCSRTTPCRTFQAAVNAAAPGGEVLALDSAGFGSTVSINKAISIIAAPGVYAGITVFPGMTGIFVSAGASDTVILRGLTIINQGSIGNGIQVFTVGTLHIESCLVEGFTDHGADGLSFGSAGALEVKDSKFIGNNIGIFVAPPPGPVVATIDHVRFEGDGAQNSAGLFLNTGTTSIRATVTNSLASGCGAGFAVGGAAAELSLENCVASNNGEGVGVNSGLARVSNCTITDNTSGLANVATSGSFILSRGNNTIEGNVTNTSGIIGSYTAK